MPQQTVIISAESVNIFVFRVTEWTFYKNLGPLFQKRCYFSLRVSKFNMFNVDGAHESVCWYRVAKLCTYKGSVYILKSRFREKVTEWTDLGGQKKLESSLGFYIVS